MASAAQALGRPSPSTRRPQHSVIPLAHGSGRHDDGSHPSELRPPVRRGPRSGPGSRTRPKSVSSRHGSSPPAVTGSIGAGPGSRGPGVRIKDDSPTDPPQRRTWSDDTLPWCSGGVGTGGSPLKKGGRGIRTMVSPIDALRAYVPSLVLDQFWAGPGELGERGLIRFEAAVLLTDISGFSILTERLAALGAKGSEELSARPERAFRSPDRGHHVPWGRRGEDGRRRVDRALDSPARGELWLWRRCGRLAAGSSSRRP